MRVSYSAKSDPLKRSATAGYEQSVTSLREMPIAIRVAECRSEFLGTMGPNASCSPNGLLFGLMRTINYES